MQEGVRDAMSIALANVQAVFAASISVPQISSSRA
jgi:hypothetical protein